MKKYIVLLTMALVAASCVRGDYNNDPDDIVGGRSIANNQEARQYMMYIADGLVTDVLDELELAISISERGASTSAHFTFDLPVTTLGANWTVKAADSNLKGMTIRCTAMDTWMIDFEGDYVFGYEENNYPTELSMTVIKYYTPEDDDSYPRGWNVTLSGSRQEWNDNKKQQGPKSTYSCTFGTSGLNELLYLNTRGRGAQGWDQVFGDLYMTVYKADEQVDVCCLSFEGSPSQATFIRGL